MVEAELESWSSQPYQDRYEELAGEWKAKQRVYTDVSFCDELDARLKLARLTSLVASLNPLAS